MSEELTKRMFNTLKCPVGAVGLWGCGAVGHSSRKYSKHLQGDTSTNRLFLGHPPVFSCGFRRHQPAGRRFVNFY